MMIFQAAGKDPLSKVLPHPLVQRELDLGLLTPEGMITLLSDQIVMIILAGLLLAVFIPMAVRRRHGTGVIDRLIFGKAGTLIEMICQYFYQQVAVPAMGPHAGKYVKYVWSVFFFVLTMNLLGLLPLPAITPPILGFMIGGTATGNIWVTGTLALLTLVLMVSGGLRLGGKDYLAHFSPGPRWISPLLVPIEIISTLARTMALAIRLFVAMLAGHILLAVLYILIPMALEGMGLGAGMPVALIVAVAGVAINLLEVFVAFLQAFIFSYLTALFIGMSVNLHHDDHHGDAHAAVEGKA